ncbi:glyco_transf_20 domain-containing protein, partial [Haematococcus lacustris]
PSDSTAVPGGWEAAVSHADFSWKKIALPILQQYQCSSLCGEPEHGLLLPWPEQESTDGSSIEAKESALVWYYKDADPDFGSWQAKELLDHLEGVLSNKPVEIVGSNQAVEIKPQGVSKGQAVYACTVGQKPSRAPFYLNDPAEVRHLLARLVGIHLPNSPIYS